VAQASVSHESLVACAPIEIWDKGTVARAALYGMQKETTCVIAYEKGPVTDGASQALFAATHLR
jgi:hypothetical protein